MQAYIRRIDWKVQCIGCLCLLILLGFSARGQHYSVERFASDNKLPVHITTCAIQDTDGYLWVGSFGGLYRYDGQRFQPYTASVKDTTGLTNNHIRVLLQASDGRIWIGTPDGLHVMENDSIRLVLLPFEEANDGANYIESILEDNRGNMWIGTAYGIFMCPADGGRTRYFLEEIEKSTCYGLHEVDNKIYAATSAGIFVYAAENDQFLNRIRPIYSDGLHERAVSPGSFARYDDQYLLLGSSVGLLHLRIHPDSIPTVHPFYDAHGNPIAREHLYDVMVDADGFIWTATFSQKFKKYRMENGRLIEVPVHLSGGDQGMAPHVMEIYQDAQKNIWISNTNGLYRLNPESKPFVRFPPDHVSDCLPEPFNVHSITGDEGRYIWIGNRHGLFRFDRRDVIKRHCPENYFQLAESPFDRVTFILVDSFDRLWVASHQGLFVSHLNDERLPIRFSHYHHENGLPHNWVCSIFVDSDQMAWVATYSGLVRMRMPNGQLGEAEFDIFVHDDEEPTSLVNTYAMELARDTSDHLWIGTFSGVSRLVSGALRVSFDNYAYDRSDPSSLSNNALKNIHLDDQGRLWFGSQLGLNLYDDTRGEFVRFGLEDGLPSEYILGLKSDTAGRLWVATTNGLMRGTFDKDSARFMDIIRYGTADGLAHRITNRNALYIDPHGTVYAGSSEGLSVLNPSYSTNEQPAFHLRLTQFDVPDTRSEGYVSVLDGIEDRAIELTHNQNSARLHYVALNLTDPANTIYRHKLLPGHTEWIYTGKESSVNLLNLAKGRYTLILEASDHHRNWKDHTIQLDITIKPPMTQTPLAWFMYVLAIVALVAYLFHMRLRRRIQKMESQVRLERALLRQREKLRQENAADFHDELGTKITKISLFLTMLERNIPNQTDLQQWTHKIRDNVNALSGGFRDLLWAIDPNKDSVNDTFLRLKEFGDELFKNSPCVFAADGYHTSLDALQLSAETKKHVILLFKEAMHNSLKHAHSQRASLELFRKNGYISLIYTDDGKGFDTNRNSNGRGLKNMHLRARKIGAALDIHSDDTSGTQIALRRIPLLGEEKNRGPL